MPWRPLVHVEDIAGAFLSVLDAPRRLVHDEAFNVGSSQENYRIWEVAEIVEEVVPDARAKFAAGGGPDKRSYQVDCSKIARSPGRPSSHAGRCVAASSNCSRRTTGTT